MLGRMGSGRNTLRRASTLMHKKELQLELGGEDDEDSLKLEIEDSEEEK